MRSITFCCMTVALALNLTTTQIQAKEDQNKDASLTPSEKSITFFKRQVASSTSVDSAIRSLLTRFPEKTVQFVEVALSAYPDQYESIISASVSTQPMFVDEIIRVATQYKVSSPTEIVSIVVTAEPSYAEIATKAACKYSPEHFNEIVKMAVKSEPDSADQIAQKLVTAYPNRTMEILVTTIKEVPFVGKYILDALLAVVAEDESTSEDMIIMSVQQLAQYPEAMERLVELANQHEIEQDKIRSSALKGGLSEEKITLVINKHYEDKK